MNRRNQILVVLLVVQLILVTGVFVWQRPAASGAGQSLFPDLETDQIVGLILTDAQGNSLQLARQAGSDGWVLPQADDYPVQEGKVVPLLDKIVGLTTDRLVTRTAASHGRLKVADDEFERLVEVELADGSLRRLYVGTSPSFGAIHVRAGGQDRVYLTSELSMQDIGAEAQAWVEREYLTIPQEEIVALTLQNDNGRFAFEKVGEDTWTMAGLAADETLNQGAVTALANRMAQTSLLRPLGKEELPGYGLADPRAVVTVRTQDEGGETRAYALYVGAQDPMDQSYVVKSSESDYYVRVAQFSVQEFVEKTREDLLVQATPQPGEGTPAEP